MRTVMNVSLPEQMAKDIEAAVKEGNFASKSEFFRHIIRLWNTKQLGERFREQKKTFNKKGGTKLKSLKDLR